MDSLILLVSVVDSSTHQQPGDVEAKHHHQQQQQHSLVAGVTDVMVTERMEEQNTEKNVFRFVSY